MRKLQSHEIETFIRTIGHSVKTTNTIHSLRQNVVNVYLLGVPGNFEAAIVQDIPYPQEPVGYGTNARAMWDLLTQIEGWEVINFEASIADELETIMQKEMAVPMKRYGDIYYQLTDVIEYHIPAEDIEVRLLSPDDREIVKTADVQMQSLSFGNIETTLAKGITAVAIVDNRIVAMADSRLADKYIDVGVFTHENWRKKGLSTATASLVIMEGQKRGLIPTWSTGEDNIASHRVAEKLGYEKVSERLYLIPQKEQS